MGWMGDELFSIANPFETLFTFPEPLESFIAAAGRVAFPLFSKRFLFTNDQGVFVAGWDGKGFPNRTKRFFDYFGVLFTKDQGVFVVGWDGKGFPNRTMCFLDLGEEGCGFLGV